MVLVPLRSVINYSSSSGTAKSYSSGSAKLRICTYQNVTESGKTANKYNFRYLLKVVL
jgi:hypothetical protein